MCVLCESCCSADSENPGRSQSDVSGGLFEGSDLTNASFYGSRIQQVLDKTMHVMIVTAQASFQLSIMANADFRRVVIGEYTPLLHPSAVTALAVWQNVIVSAGQDGVVRMWNADTGQVCSFPLLCLSPSLRRS